MTSTMQRLSAGLAVALLTLSGLAACNDDPPPDAPTKSADPTATHTTAPNSTGPTEPELPNAAQTGTEAGAIAFVTHYYALIDFAQVTERTDLLLKASSPGCVPCIAGAKHLDKIFAANGVITGGTHKVLRASARELRRTTASQAAVWVVDGRVHLTKQRITGTGHLDAVFTAGESLAQFTLSRSDDEWMVTSIKITGVS